MLNRKESLPHFKWVGPYTRIWRTAVCPRTPYDHGVRQFLPGQHALAFQHFHQGRHLPPGGDGQLFKGDEAGGVRRMGRQAASQ